MNSYRAIFAISSNDGRIWIYDCKGREKYLIDIKRSMIKIIEKIKSIQSSTKSSVRHSPRLDNNNHHLNHEYDQYNHPPPSPLQHHLNNHRQYKTVGAADHDDVDGGYVGYEGQNSSEVGLGLPSPPIKTSSSSTSTSTSLSSLANIIEYHYKKFNLTDLCSTDHPIIPLDLLFITEDILLICSNQFLFVMNCLNFEVDLIDCFNGSIVMLSNGSISILSSLSSSTLMNHHPQQLHNQIPQNNVNNSNNNNNLNHFRVLVLPSMFITRYISLRVFYHYKFS